MKTKDIIIVHPQNNEQIAALKAFMNALKIKFEVSSNEDYNSEFVEKILESEKQISEGETRKIQKDDLDKFFGL